VRLEFPTSLFAFSIFTVSIFAFMMFSLSLFAQYNRHESLDFDLTRFLCVLIIIGICSAAQSGRGQKCCPSFCFSPLPFSLLLLLREKGLLCFCLVTAL
jgi:hypothetical protein